MASKRSGTVLVLVVLTSFVSALEFTQISSNENDVLGWTGGAQVDQPVVFPGPSAEPWMPSEDIPATLERMCSITCQAGNDQDQKGFCDVYSTLVRLASMNCSYTDADMEKVDKECLDACKKVRKGNNSHKEARKRLCKAYGKNSYSMTLLIKGGNGANEQTTSTTPTTTSMTGIWKLGGKGQSCDEVCSDIGKKCDLDALLEIKDGEKANEIFKKLPCTSGPKTPFKTSVKAVSPSVLEYTFFGNHFNCFYDGDGRNAKCDSQHSKYKRLCFCKN